MREERGNRLGGWKNVFDRDKRNLISHRWTCSDTLGNVSMQSINPSIRQIQCRRLTSVRLISMCVCNVCAVQQFKKSITPAGRHTCA